MPVRTISIAALGAIGGLLVNQILKEPGFPFPEVLAVGPTTLDFELSQCEAPLLLTALLLPTPHSWRRWRIAKGTPQVSASVFEQLPHIASTDALRHGPQDGDSEVAQYQGPRKIFRKDYKPPEFAIDSIDLTLKLDEENTKVLSTLKVRRHQSTSFEDLVLDGKELQLEWLLLNGKELPAKATGGYSLTDDGKLRISKHALPKQNNVPFELQTAVTVHPKANLELMGLYMSDGMFITHCEPAGFRRITYTLDRPDVLTRFRVRVEADAKEYPVLLSNGNKIEEGLLDGATERHYAVFEDPYPKPSYLFAVVAGKLGVMKDTFKTKSGREVTLQLFADPESVDRLDLSRQVLKQSMQWDEENFGREYDLSFLNVVCVNDFNQGAMENKGLLIFNCHQLLADPKTTTDLEYSAMVSTVAHEYFHNWTGNRVTVRDWFELTLKEGLTTFREQLFSAAVGAAAVERIETVKHMMNFQFKEDAGPMAHPIRPESYAAVDNLYTSTVYSKGAEVHRMYQTILGVDGFRLGMNLYFERYDGKAVTSEEFLTAMADANGVDLSQFALWYSQAGTPHVRVEKTSYNRKLRRFSITLSQHTPPTPGEPTKLPLMIPIKIGLIGKESKKDLLNPPSKVIMLKRESETFYFSNVKEDCVPSILRDFSAPVKLQQEHSAEQLAFLMAYDTDPVNKWRAAQELASSIILSRARLATQNLSLSDLAPLPPMFLDALKTMLRSETTDGEVKALTLRLPEMNELEQTMQPLDPEALHRARTSVKRDIASHLKTEMIELYEQLTVNESEKFDQQGIRRRRLRNELLWFLSEFRDREAAERAYKHFSDARCMTDKFYSLLSLTSIDQPEREVAFDRFYADANEILPDSCEGPLLETVGGSNTGRSLTENLPKLQQGCAVSMAAPGNAQVIDIWFRMKAASDLPNQIERVRLLQDHPAFSFANPNRLRSLLMILCAWNRVHFHRSDGAGYKLIADAVLKVDKINTFMAASLAKLLSGWRSLTEDRKILMKKELMRIHGVPTISDNLKDVVSKFLVEK